MPQTFSPPDSEPLRQIVRSEVCHMITVGLALTAMKLSTGEWPWMAQVKPSAPIQIPPQIVPQPPVVLAAEIPEYLDADPATKIPYSATIPFYEGDAQTSRLEGGDSNTPGHYWEFSWTAPGPVTSVTPDSGAGIGYQRTYPCESHDNIGKCSGWINSGNPHRTMIVPWKQGNPKHQTATMK